ncbi:unnamed protein product [Phytophthora fragariaefolia]|uniref:Unnamed protein product n=1 Tax=Phytophthora fragariaefolia TaxID=1490495 RepID=A0A9W6Y580_9STRA|nr:unnamed protein product [Phytophthora fragariaefolia]
MPTSRSQGPRLRTTHVLKFLQDHATVMMNWSRRWDLLNHLEAGTQVPPEWQTAITVMTNDNLAFQAPSFVRMDPPHDEDDEETKGSDPGSRRLSGPVPGRVHNSFRVPVIPVRQAGVRFSVPQVSQEVGSRGWVGSTSPCRPEEMPLLLSPAQARASLADYPAVWKDLRGMSSS